MSRHKRCIFAVLATIVAVAAAGKSDLRSRKFDIPKPRILVHGPAVADGGSLGYESRSTRQPGRSQRVTAFRAESEMPPTIFLPVQSTIFLPVQSKSAGALSAGKLLVASRDLADPHFAQTVVLLVHYDAKGVLGLILNRRTDLPLSQVLEGLKAAKDRSDPIYLGGPVETQEVVALFQSPSNIKGSERIFGQVYLISDKTLFEQTIAARPAPDVFHAYLGYAGWTMNQLRKEVELGAWFIFPADANPVFSEDPDLLWSQMIQKTELKMAESQPADAGRNDGFPDLPTPWDVRRSAQ